jgi:tetratricopeptide (TPR) repeat protein
MNPELDAEELKFLAIQASQREEPQQALLYLKHAITQSPQDGELHYLLAAEHAQLGMYDRAAHEMTQALQLKPDMHTARLQLALLHLGAARVEAASADIEVLKKLDANSCFHHFGHGLDHLMHDRFGPCRQALERGIALNHANAALNGDMQKIIAALPEQDDADPDGSIWLSAYRENDSPQ